MRSEAIPFMKRAALLATVLAGSWLLGMAPTDVDALPPAGVIDTVVGGGAGDGSNPAAANFNDPRGVAVDGGGAVFVADYANCRVRRIVSGVVSTVAGTGTCGFGANGIAATSSELNYPSGVAVDAGGDLYIGEFGSCQIRRVSAGIITSIAGTGLCGSPSLASGVGATSIGLANVVGIAVAGTDVYLTENNGAFCLMRRVTGGVISTIAGTGTCGTSPDGAAAATFIMPWDLAHDGAGGVLFADTGSCKIRRVASGLVSTVAGTGSCASGADGPALSTGMDNPRGVARTASGDLYVTEACAIRRISGGMVTLIAGSTSGANCEYSGDGGPALSAHLYYPHGVAVTAGGLVVADRGNCRIRSITAGIIDTFAGTGSCTYGGDGGPAEEAALGDPADIDVTSSGDIYINDSCRIRKVSAGIVTRVAGTGTCATSGDGGDPLVADIYPWAFAVTDAGVVYVGDPYSCVVRRIAGGVITRFAGTGVCGTNGEGLNALDTQLAGPVALITTPDGTAVYVGDNCRILRISGGVTTRIAGMANDCDVTGDGGPALNAKLDGPIDFALDASENLYITSWGCRIRRIRNGIITRVVTSSCGVQGDGTLALMFGADLQWVDVDAHGNLYGGTYFTCRVRGIYRAGAVRVAGDDCGFGGDGGPARDALLGETRQVIAGPSGELYVVDRGNRRIRVISPDFDADGLSEAVDRCPVLATANQANNDGNFIELGAAKAFDDLTRPASDEWGDECDDDDDNDGISDASEINGSGCWTTTNPLAADWDGDLYLDGAECGRGTDPNDPGDKPTIMACGGTSDDDNDGLVRYRELCQYGTSDDFADSDGDDCSDRREVASINGDRTVNAIDLSQVAMAFGSSGSPNYLVNFDITRDGTINATDLSQVAQAFGPCTT